MNSVTVPDADAAYFTKVPRALAYEPLQIVEEEGEPACSTVDMPRINLKARIVLCGFKPGMTCFS
jgi:hypothetical protein